jgi:hypothetical protein
MKPLELHLLAEAIDRVLTSSPELTKKKPGANMKVLDSGLSRDFRRRPTLPHSLPCSTIGAEELNFRVRDGNGCDLFAIATEKTGINAITYNLGIRCIVACACDQFNCVR